MASSVNNNNNNSNTDYMPDDFYNELQEYNEESMDAWFLPIGSEVKSSSPGIERDSKLGIRRASLSPCSDSNQSLLSNTSCMFDPQQQRGSSCVTPSASSICSSSAASTTGGPPSFKGSLAAQAVPSNIPYQGQFGFQMAFDAQPRDTKAVAWTYSPALRKLFVRMANSCPIKFRTELQPPAGSVIRATPTYIRPEHVQDTVRRCPNHATSPEYNEDGHPAPAHLLRCDHAAAQYGSAPTAATHGPDAAPNKGRHSVVIPHEQPQAGSEWLTHLYQFMCFSSCVGGLNRRPLQVIFTLEHQGTVLGRQSIEVRICACPGRDRRGEENAIFPAPKPVKRPFSSLGNGKISSAAPPKRTKLNGIETEEFTLVIRGKENFEILSKVRDSLELAFFLAQSVVQPGMQQNMMPAMPQNMLPAAPSKQVFHTPQPFIRTTRSAVRKQVG